MFKIKFVFILCLLTQSYAQANEPAFEAFSKLIIGGVHSGYSVQRITIDNKKKQIESIYYLYMKTATDSTTESLTAKADLNFEPISYKYTALVNGVAKLVDANFKNKMMTATQVDGKKKVTVKLTVPPNGFLSTFLSYVVLKNGLAINKSYSFKALAEEVPACMPNNPNCDPKNVGFIDGTVLVKSEEKFKGLDAFRLNINYKGIDFQGFVNAKGETLGTVSPLQNASTEIVATKEEAVGGFVYNNEHIKALFGKLPIGNKNALHTKSL